MNAWFFRARDLGAGVANGVRARVREFLRHLLLGHDMRFEAAAIGLMVMAIATILFLWVSQGPTELGARTDAAATATAVEAGPQGMFSDNGQALTPVKVSPHEQIDPETGTSTPHVHCGTLNSASVGQFRLTYRLGVVSAVSGSYSITGADPWPPSCGSVSVSGTGYTAHWYAPLRVHYPPPDFTSVILPERRYSSGGSISCGVTGTGRFSCGGGGSSAPTEDISPQGWRFDYWQTHSRIQVCYNGTCVTASTIIATPPKPRPPPPTPTPLADPISATLEITSSPVAHSTYAIGETIEVKASFDADITIATSSPPSLRVALDSGIRTAAYDRMSGNRDLYFQYTVVEGDSDVTGASIPENPLSRHVYVNDEKRRLVNPGLQSDADHRVDGVRPRVSQLQFNVGAFSALKAADTGYDIELIATFSEDVEVTGVPEIGITVNSEAATATFSGPSGLTLNKDFNYELTRGSSSETSTTTSVAVPAGSVTLDSGEAVKDLVGNDAILDYNSLRATSMTAFDRTGPALEGLSIVGATNRYGWLRLCQVKRGFSFPYLFQGCEKLNDPSNGQGFVDIVAQFDEAITTSAHNNASLDVVLDGGTTSDTEIALNSSIGRDATAGKIKFKYYVKAGEDAPGGISVPAGVLDCGSNSNCNDPSNNAPSDGDLTHVGLPVQPQYRVDGSRSRRSRASRCCRRPPAARAGTESTTPSVSGCDSVSRCWSGPTGRPRRRRPSTCFIPNTGGNLKLPLTLDTAATTPTDLLRRPGDIMGRGARLPVHCARGRQRPDGHRGGREHVDQDPGRGPVPTPTTTTRGP